MACDGNRNGPQGDYPGARSIYSVLRYRRFPISFLT